MHARRVVSAVAFVLACAGGLPALRAQAVPAGSGVAAPEDPLLLLAPTRFTKSRSRVDTFERSFTVPPWIVAPYTMRVQNGEPDGSNRLVLGWIWVNGQRVAAPSDFSRNRNRRFDNESERSSFNYQDDDDNEDGQGSSRRGQPVSDGALTGTLALRAQNTLRVRLAGRRDRYITVSIRGTSGDHTAPALTFVEPAVSITNSAAVRVRLRYTDPVGSGELAASGVVLSTLRVTVDGTDRTSSFAASTTEALASLNLGEGPHVLQAQVRDRAGNASTASSSLAVDSVPPSVTITQPSAGLITSDSSVRLSGAASDTSPFAVRVGGAEATVADGRFGADVGLPAEGSNTLSVTARDQAGNETTVDVSVTADRMPPQLTIVSPAADDELVANLPFSVQSEVNDLTAVSVTIDGVPANFVGNTWSGSIDAAPDGTHTVTVVATDSAGNQTTQTRGFVLDTTAPVVTILEPVSDTSTISTDATVTGTVDDLTLQSVAVNGVLALLQDVATGSSRTFTAMVPLTMGANQIVVVGTDATGRTGVAEVSLTRVPPCQVTVSPSSVTAPAEGATGVLIVSNLTTCFWTASTNTAWITISGTADGYAG